MQHVLISEMCGMQSRGKEERRKKYGTQQAQIYMQFVQGQVEEAEEELEEQIVCKPFCSAYIESVERLSQTTIRLLNAKPCVLEESSEFHNLP